MSSNPKIQKNEINITSTLKGQKHFYYSKCVLAINDVKSLNDSVEMPSEVFHIRELDLEWFYICKISSNLLCLSIKIKNCGRMIAATVNVVGGQTTTIPSLHNKLENYINGNRYISLSNSQFVNDGVLRITINIIFSQLKFVDLTEPQRLREYPELAIEYMSSNRLEKLFNSQKHSDVTFVIDDKKLLAHKVLLLGKSAVFDAMFEHPMKEKEENVVKIEDIKYEVFEEMIKFIYTNNSEKLADMAEALLVAADKYEIVVLREQCIQYLQETLSASSVIQIIILAYLHSLNGLKDSCLKFIIQNHSLLDIKSLQNYPQLLTEILEYTFKNTVCKIET